MTSNNPFFYYGKAFANFANFQGRAGRKEYWLFFLANMIIGIGLSIVCAKISWKLYFVGSNIYELVIILPSVAYAIRRLHDTNHSGWWILVPVVNIILLLTEGTPGLNNFGPEPVR